ncbi:MAG: catalase [Deltaproteobacteria bacterium]|nr:catalase [Deltaproteobacteria bacterium]
MSISPVGIIYTRPVATSSLVRAQTVTGHQQSTHEKAAHARSAAETNGNHLDSRTSQIQPKNETERTSALSSQKQSSRNNAGGQQLSEEEQREVEKLKARDAEVRAHEAAHLAAAGQYAVSGASFDYQTGPDGMRYAVGGDVSISVSNEQTPEATVAKMQVVIRAALAPASPSSQDHRVAAEASQKQASAQREISQQNVEQREQGGQAQSSEVHPNEGNHSKPVSDNLVSADGASAGFSAISEKARTTGAQKAYSSVLSAVTTVNWTA